MRNGFAAVVALAIAGGAQVQAQEDVAGFTGRIFNFGDSLSDDGNPRVPTLPPALYPTGRFSDGPVAAEFLPELLGAETGINVARGGATSAEILGQTQAFVAGGGRMGPTDYAFLWGHGPNDYFAAIPAATLSPNPQAVIGAAVRQVQTNIFQSAATLDAAGADRFIFATLPDFGSLPLFNANPAQAGAASLVSGAHNGALVQTAGAMSSFGEVTLVDVDGLFGTVVADPGAFGFANVTQAIIPSSPGCNANPTLSPATNLFYDCVHPTTAAHRLVAAAIADAVVAPRLLGANLEAETARARDFGEAMLSFGDRPAGLSIGRFGSIDVFTSGRAFRFDRDGTDRAAGFDSTGGRLGLSFLDDSQAVLFGGSVVYERASTDAGTQETDTDALRFGFFATGQSTLGAGLSLQNGVSASGSLVSYDSVRTPGIGAATISGDTQGTTIGLNAESRLAVATGSGLTFGPMVRIGYATAEIDGYTETGVLNGVNRTYDRADRDTVYGAVGAFAGFSAGQIEGIAALLYEEVISDDGTVSSRASSLPGFSTVTDVTADRDGAVVVEANVSLLSLGGISLGADAVGAFGDGRNDASIGLSLDLTF